MQAGGTLFAMGSVLYSHEVHINRRHTFGRPAIIRGWSNERLNMESRVR